MQTEATAPDPQPPTLAIPVTRPGPQSGGMLARFLSAIRGTR